MNAGIPGTGIGGLFYLASALFMPVHRLLRGGGHEGRSWTRVLRHVVIASGILLAVYVSIRVIGTASDMYTARLIAKASVDGSTPDAMLAARHQTSTLLSWFAALGAGSFLVLVLGTVEIARLVFRRRGDAPARMQSGVVPHAIDASHERFDPPGTGQQELPEVA
ncbi:MAG: hypothetical protein ACREK1_10455 [Longimicrobiales bacterium]